MDKRNNLSRDRVVGNTHKTSDYFHQQHISTVQAFRRHHDAAVPNSGTRLYEVFQTGFRISSEFFGLVQPPLLAILPFLCEGKTYTVEALLGLQFLTALNSGERRMVDQCIEKLIDRGMPLQVVQTPAGQPCAYRFLGLTIGHGAQSE